MKCKDCKHWTRIENKLFQYFAPVDGLPHGGPSVYRENPNTTTHTFVGDLPASSFGRCSSPKLIEGGSFPIRVDGTVEMRGTEANDEMLLDDGEGRGDGFATGENFGCVHFEAKP